MSRKIDYTKEFDVIAVPGQTLVSHTVVVYEVGGGKTPWVKTNLTKEDMLSWNRARGIQPRKGKDHE